MTRLTKNHTPMKALKKLTELDSKLTKAIELRSRQDEEDGQSSRMKGAAGALIAGAGAYSIHNQVMKRYVGGPGPYAADGRLVKPGMEGLKRAYTKAGKDVKNYAPKVGKELKKAGSYYKAARSGATEGLGHNVYGAVKSAAVRTMRGVRALSEKQVAKMIVELDAKIDQIADSRAQRMEFAKKPMPFKKKSKRDMDGDMDNSKGKC